MTQQNENHEIRKLRWQNRQLGKQLGKAGATIHQLRGELAEVREINGKIARGEVRDLERSVVTLITENARLDRVVANAHGEVRRLREKIDSFQAYSSSPSVAETETATAAYL
jgi:predicted RNase H-like nuclease (RuvC/YqgF family)